MSILHRRCIRFGGFLRSGGVFVVAFLLVVGVIFPGYAICSASLDPPRLAQYDAMNISSRRIERGLGSPNRIEHRIDGVGYVYWYNWTIWDTTGKIKDRGEAGFQFNHDNRLIGFSIFVLDKNGKFVETTLQDVISFSKR